MSATPSAPLIELFTTGHLIIDFSGDWKTTDLHMLCVILKEVSPSIAEPAYTFSPYYYYERGRWFATDFKRGKPAIKPHVFFA